MLLFNKPTLWYQLTLHDYIKCYFLSDSLSLKVAMSVSINKTFKNTFKHSESDDYKELESKFKTQVGNVA